VLTWTLTFTPTPILELLAIIDRKYLRSLGPGIGGATPMFGNDAIRKHELSRRHSNCLDLLTIRHAVPDLTIHVGESI
jgi:hypothetical protein